MSEVNNRGGSPNKKQIEPINDKAIAAKEAQRRRTTKEISFYDKYAYQIVLAAFIIICLSAIISYMFSSAKQISEIAVNDEIELAAHNSIGDSYSIGRVSFFDQQMLTDARDIMNVTLTTRTKLHQCTTNQVGTIIPESYDFRKVFPNCDRTLNEQGNITSGHVLASLKTLSDRFCSQTGGEYSEQISAQAIITCDKKALWKGTISRVFDSARKGGIPSESCYPYDKNIIDDDKCSSKLNQCTERKSILGYCVASTEEGIKREIMQNGPINVVIPLYRNFLNYKTGIFSVTENSAKLRAGVALNVIGWDTSANGQQYWIVENFWGENWGQNGVAFIAIGIQDLYIDEYGLAPIPNIESNRQAAEEQARQMQQQNENNNNVVETDLDNDN